MPDIQINRAIALWAVGLSWFGGIVMSMYAAVKFAKQDELWPAFTVAVALVSWLVGALFGNHGQLAGMFNNVDDESIGERDE